MAMGSLDTTTVTLIPDQLIMSQELDMAIFHIIDWTLDNKNSKPAFLFLENFPTKEESGCPMVARKAKPVKAGYSDSPQCPKVEFCSLLSQVTPLSSARPISNFKEAFSAACN